MEPGNSVSYGRSAYERYISFLHLTDQKKFDDLSEKMQMAWDEAAYTAGQLEAKVNQEFGREITGLHAELTRLRGLIEGVGHEAKCETLQLRHYLGPCDCIQSKVNL